MTTYGEAGVDLEGADRHVEAIANPVTATWTEDVIGSFGGFAAGVTIPAGYREPVLMMSTDGVGTKLELARRAGRWDGVGQDLVAMCVDDLAAVGARPLGFVDYLAVGALNADARPGHRRIGGRGMCHRRVPVAGRGDRRAPRCDGARCRRPGRRGHGHRGARPGAWARPWWQRVTSSWVWSHPTCGRMGSPSSVRCLATTSSPNSTDFSNLRSSTHRLS